MKNQRFVQFAVMCLRAFEGEAGRALSPRDISRHQGIPLLECLRILQRFIAAGIVHSVARGKVVLVRPADELTALEVLEALWAPDPTQPALKMLMGGNHGRRIQMTSHYLERVSAEGSEVNG